MGGLSGFKERKSHVLTAGTGAGANYQMRIHIIYGAGADSGEDMYCDSKCNADFSDLRFTSSDEQTLLSYWLESKLDGDNAIFWVKVTEDLDSDRTIYVYYGNSYAVSLSSQANTFVDVISGVVGAWNMEEDHAADAVVDYSGNGNDGTPTGTSIVPSNFVDKTARQFNGIADVVTIADDAVLDLTTELSLIYWFKSAAGDIPAVEKTLSYLSYYDGTGGNLASATCYSDPAASIEKALVRDANWHLIVYTYKKNDVQTLAFDNGVAATEAVVSNIDVTAFDLKIGYVFAASRSGTIGGVYLLNNAVTTIQRTNMFSNYPDVGLEAGKVLIRKYAATALPTHGDWGTELSLPCYCSRHARRRRLKRGR
jgi:hypothetical protein